MMMHGGNGDRSRIQLQIGLEQFVNSRKDRNLVLRRSLGGPSGIRLDCRDKRDARSRRLQLAIDTKMVLAKCSRSGNGNAQNRLASYFVAPLSGPCPSTAFRQRL